MANDSLRGEDAGNPILDLDLDLGLERLEGIGRSLSCLRYIVLLFRYHDRDSESALMGDVDVGRFLAADGAAGLQRWKLAQYSNRHC